jgi:predicted phosphodiesterase
MRVAALYDIHGNLPALEAVLAELPRVSVTQVVIGGDIHPGPMANEVMRRLERLDLPVQYLMGNGDREVLAQRNTGATAVPEPFASAIRWNAAQLTAASAERIARWPATLRMDIPGPGTALFCHATPRNDTEIFTKRTAEDRLLPVFAGVNASIVVCGHTHMQFDRRVGNVRVVNAGSVGMPFGVPGAYWTLLGPSVELRCTKYDVHAAAERIRSTDYPGADDFAAQHVIAPPSEDTILTAYASAELR